MVSEVTDSNSMWVLARVGKGTVGNGKRNGLGGYPNAVGAGGTMLSGVESGALVSGVDSGTMLSGVLALFIVLVIAFLKN